MILQTQSWATEVKSKEQRTIRYAYRIKSKEPSLLHYGNLHKTEGQSKNIPQTQPRKRFPMILFQVCHVLWRSFICGEYQTTMPHGTPKVPNYLGCDFLIWAIADPTLILNSVSLNYIKQRQFCCTDLLSVWHNLKSKIIKLDASHFSLSFAINTPFQTQHPIMWGPTTYFQNPSRSFGSFRHHKKLDS